MSRKKLKVKKRGPAPETWQPLARNYDAERANEKQRQLLNHFDEIWANDIYAVFVRFNVPAIPKEALPFEFTWLSIKRHDKAPCNDWRHFQFIKNQLCGPEAEGAQLYPAESRLVDGSNQYHIWVINAPGFRFPFGFNEARQISETPLPGGRQRPWPENMKPVDLEEQEERQAKGMDDYLQKIKTS